MASTSKGLPLTPDSVKISALAKADRDLAEAMDLILSGKLTAEISAAVTAAAEAAAAGQQLGFVLPWIAETVRGAGKVHRGTPTFGAGKFDKALTSGQVLLDNLAKEPNGYAITLECWARTSTPPTGNEKLIWQMTNNTWLSAEEGTGYGRITVAFAVNSRLTSTINICDGQWHHLAVSLSRDVAAAITYLEGFWIDGKPVPGSPPSNSRAWAPDVIVGGHLTNTVYNWPGQIDDLKLSYGKKYGAAFTPPTAPQELDNRTLFLAPMDSLEAWAGLTGYPARPDGAPNGSVTYAGPVPPTDWHTDDEWRKLS